MFRSIRRSGLSRLSAIRRRLRVSGWRHAQRLAPIGLFVVAALAWRGVGAAPAADERAVPEPEAVAQCSVCHDSQAAAWAKSVHRRTVGAPHIPKERQGCTACHQGVAAHLDDPSAAVPGLRLTELGADQVIAMCLSCHKDAEQIMFRTSAHAKLPKACLSCHHPHAGEGREMLREPEPELCDKCHPQQAAETRLPSHHPIPEGKMVCTDCHNVHGDQRNNLRGASTPEMCYKCHSDKAGPFLGEHPPVTEDCAICHKPHGSQNDRLLVMDQPILCLRCHPGHHDSHRTSLVSVGTPADQAQGITGIHAFYNKCTSCHSLIHGTDLTSGTGNPTFMPGSPATPLGRASATNSGPSLGLAGAAALGLEGDGASWGFSELELGQISEKGNPTFVREYDGKNYEFPRMKLGVDQYAKNSDFHFRLRDPAARDEDAETYFGNQNVSADIKYSALTHRQPRFNDIPTAVDIAGGGGSPAVVTPEDLTGGKNDFALSRKVLDMNLYARHSKLPQVRWMAKYWRQEKTGDQQFTFLDRCSSCHKVQTTQPINNVTTDAAAGFEVDLNKAAARYMHHEGRFENRAPEGFFDFTGQFGLFNGTAPMFGVADTRSRSDEIRVAAQPIPTLALTGLWNDGKRANLFSQSELNIRTAGGGATWRFAHDVALVASYFSNEFDNGARLQNPEALSRNRKTTRAELRYTGLPWTTLSAGYMRQDVDRTTEHAVVPADSKTNTWSANAITNLPNGASLNLRYRRATTDTRLSFDAAAPPDELLEEIFPSRWIAPPTEDTLLSAVATYGIARNVLGTLLYSKLDRSFAVDVPGLAVSKRSDESIKTLGAEAYYLPGKRTRLTAGFYKQEGDSNSDVQYGIDDFTLLPPLGPDGVFPPIKSRATFNYDATILRLDASHWLTSRVRVFGRFARTRSNGAVLAGDLGDYLDQNPDLNGVALTLNPFAITLEDKWLGVSYLVDPFTEVALSFEARSWDNGRDFTQNGSYDLWRIGVRKSL